MRTEQRCIRRKLHSLDWNSESTDDVDNHFITEFHLKPFIAISPSDINTTYNSAETNLTRNREELSNLIGYIQGIPTTSFKAYHDSPRCHEIVMLTPLQQESEGHEYPSRQVY